MRGRSEAPLRGVRCGIGFIGTAEAVPFRTSGQRFTQPGGNSLRGRRWGWGRGKQQQVPPLAVAGRSGGGRNDTGGCKALSTALIFSLCE